MTSQPPPAPGSGRSPGPYLAQVRDLAAYALVGATAVFLFVALLELIPAAGEGNYGGRAADSFGNFINLVTIAFPIGAVLLALLVRPPHPKARLIVVAALVEYAVMALFGLLFGFLIGLINLASDSGARAAFEGLLVRVAWLAVFAVAAYAVYLIWRNLFYVPKPKPQPGVYGQPQYGPPGSYPAQPGYAPQPGQPGPPPGQPGPPPGQPGQGYPPPSQAPNYAPGVYGQSAPGWNQPAATMPGAGVAETQPVPPGTAYPASTDPSATQVMPQSGPPATEQVHNSASEDRPHEDRPYGDRPRD